MGSNTVLYCMSYADKMFVTIVFVAFVLLVFSIVKLVSPSHKKMLTKKLAFLALLVTPIVQLFFFVLVLQIYYAQEVGRSAYGFVCSSLHGGGLSSGCSIFEAIFEGATAAVIYSFVTLGLLPLATFFVTLLVLVSLKKLLNH